MSEAQDHIDRLSQLATQRSAFEQAWRQVSRVAAPDAKEFLAKGPAIGPSVINTFIRQPVAAQRSKDIYDVTAINAVDRLGSGIEAIVCPQSEYWHGLDVIDFKNVVRKRSDEEKLWLENQRNLMFALRYDADSGFVPAIQTAIRRCIAFGNAFVWVEENLDDNTSVFRYQYIPLDECYIAENKNGVVNAWYRLYQLTAAQAKQKFGDRLKGSVARAADNPSDKDRMFPFIHAVYESADWSVGKSPFKFSSVHIEYETRTIVGRRGFYEFPVIDFRWLPEPGRVYGEGPVMRVLAEIQSANVLAKNELIASEQSVKPPLLMAHAGVMNRPNANPNSVIFGGLNAQGQELVKPLNIGQRLDFATMVLEAKKNAIKESLYLNLFQVLVQNPQMSATEALIRANEKGELLGPAGSRLQGSLSRMITREHSILVRRGLYDRESAYAPPPGVSGKLNVQFTSPLDKMRRAKEGEGIARILEMVAPLAQVDPSIVDNIDADETVRQMQDILGAPVSILRNQDKVAQIRADRQRQQAMAQNAALAEQLSKASKQGTEALAGAKQAGIF